MYLDLSWLMFVVGSYLKGASLDCDVGYTACLSYTIWTLTACVWCVRDACTDGSFADSSCRLSAGCCPPIFWPLLGHAVFSDGL